MHVTSPYRTDGKRFHFDCEGRTFDCVLEHLVSKETNQQVFTPAFSIGQRDLIVLKTQQKHSDLVSAWRWNRRRHCRLFDGTTNLLNVDFRNSAQIRVV